jgi:hypothetical protein
VNKPQPYDNPSKEDLSDDTLYISHILRCPPDTAYIPLRFVIAYRNHDMFVLPYFFVFPITHKQSFQA